MSRNPRPRCSATLKDGKTRCNNNAADGSELCARHEREAGLVAEPEPVAVEPVEAVEVEKSESAEVPRRVVHDFRQELRQEAAERYDAVAGALFDALDAETDRWIACKSCGQKTIYFGPDHRARIEAANKLVELGYGKSREQAAKPPSLDELQLGPSLHEMSDDQLEAYLLAIYLSDPEELERERKQRETVVAAVEAGESVEQAALRAVEELGVTHERIAQALGLGEPAAA